MKSLLGCPYAWGNMLRCLLQFHCVRKCDAVPSKVPFQGRICDTVPYWLPDMRGNMIKCPLGCCYIEQNSLECPSIEEQVMKSPYRVHLLVRECNKSAVYNINSICKKKCDEMPYSVQENVMRSSLRCPSSGEYVMLWSIGFPTW